MGSASSNREFPQVKVRREGNILSAFEIQCAAAGCDTRQLMVIAPGKRLNPIAAEQCFRNQGWRVGKKPRLDRCPKCTRKARPKLKVVDMEKPEAEPPRSMTRDDRRIIFAKIDDLYLDDKSGYTPPWTDGAVARDLGVPKVWVQTVREDLFGPAGSNADFDDFLEQAAPIIADMKNLYRSAVAQLEQARDLAARFDAVEKLARRVERDIENPDRRPGKGP